MRIEDCYRGLMVVGTDEANREYSVTIKDVVCIIENIYIPAVDSEDEDDVAEIYVRASGTQTKEEIIDIIQNNVGSTPYEATSKEIDGFFDVGYWVSPDFFEPYQAEPKNIVSLSEYIM